jgi:hypothetical protein
VVGEAFAAAISGVRARIEDAARRAGRAPQEIRLMAVTKGFPRETVEAAAAAGLSLFGENRVQEAEAKFIDIAVPCELHLIGHLQRNKARTASGLFSCVQSIDREETAIALEERCSERGRTMDILLELNTSGELTKSGFRSREGLLACIDSIQRLGHLKVRGMMTVGPLSDDAGLIRRSFSALRALFEEIRSGGGIPGFDTLSMGMSGDFETAVEEGSTLVRIGTALFGPRRKA